jgi:rhodanese-related sulfurtransferase/CBS domain-containing protein
MAEIQPREINREDLRTLQRRGAQVVDVLPAEEYEQAHLVGAINLPMERISRLTADRLQWDKPVVVYSRDSLCDLSARAAWRLSSLGFTQVYRYTLGKADWLANGLPAEGPAARAAAVGDHADMDVPTCSRLDRVGQVKERVQAEGWNVCVVVNDDLVVLGVLRPSDLEKADLKWTAEETMDRDPVTFRLNAPLEDARQTVEARRLEYVLVTTTDGKLFGLVKREQLFEA